MIEGRPDPITGGMASTTIRTKLSPVRIPRSVTGITVFWRTAINTVCMARITLHIAVPASQWETCIRMIKCCPAPAIRGMTGTAIRSKLTTMGILCSMASITILGRTFENTS